MCVCARKDPGGSLRGGLGSGGQILNFLPLSRLWVGLGDEKREREKEEEGRGNRKMEWGRGEWRRSLRA